MLFLYLLLRWWHLVDFQHVVFRRLDILLCLISLTSAHHVLVVVVVVKWLFLLHIHILLNVLLSSWSVAFE